VCGIAVETQRVRSLSLNVAGWERHLPGQHVDIRLTAENGYQAQRSYSIATPPEEDVPGLTVERVIDGEVSPYLVDEVKVGDQFELRGPIGGHFVWTVAAGGPIFLIAGGSGIVPLMAMLRHRRRQNDHTPAVLIYSARSMEDIIYRKELDELASNDSNLRVVIALTRVQPQGWKGHRGRIDESLLVHAGFPARDTPTNFICGPTSFVEYISALLIELGHHERSIKTERFGPSGPVR